MFRKRRNEGYSNRSEKAAITLQKYMRGYLARKNHLITSAEDYMLIEDESLLVGNDPDIKGLETFQVKDEKIALVATSYLRAISLACELGNSTHLPKIILIDYNKNVIALWRRIRAFIRNDNIAATEEMFFKNFPRFLTLCKNLYVDVKATEMLGRFGPAYLNQDPIVYFQKLFQQFWVRICA